MNIILGPPGTGKTTSLLNIMEEALSQNMDPKKIGFISFTKRAIREARDRVKIKFNLSSTQVQNFRTLHSFAFRYLGLSTRNLMTKKNFQEFADVMGIELQGIDDISDPEDVETPVFQDGDRLLFLDGVARNTMKDIKSTWEKYGGDTLDFFEVNRVHIGLMLYKQQFAIMDYTDLLERFLTEDFNVNFDLLLIDEAQDLSTLQWRVLEKIISKSKVVYIAGDDDQAIFRWAGADIEHFINLQGNVKVLDQSYRLPKEVHEYAKTILSNIGFRRSKLFNYASTHSGSVSTVNDLEALDFSKGTWLVLARSAYSLIPHITFARESGIYFAYKSRGPNESLYARAIQAYIRLQQKRKVEERELRVLEAFLSKPFDPTVPWHLSLNIGTEQSLWFKTLEESGEDLFKPRVQFSTIHGAKGAEADNVVICPDLSYKAYNEMQENPDDEARVFYVGVTRAKRNLFILTPQTRYFYEL